MKIGQKLILGLVIIALMIEIVGYICLNSSQNALQESISESSASLATTTLDRIDRGIYSRIEEFQTYSTDTILQEVIKKSNKKSEQLDYIRSCIEQKDKEWTSVPKETVTAFMLQLINNKLSEELRNRLKFYEKEYGYAVVGEVVVTNKYGTNVAQTGKTTDYKQDDEQWWQNAKTDGLYVTDVGYNESANVYSTDIGIRIEDEFGNFIGVIKLVLNIQEVINVINETGLTKGHKWHKTMHFKLLTKEGKNIYSTKPGSQSLENTDIDLFSQFGQVQEAGHKCYFIGKADEPDAEERLFVHAHSKGYKDYKGLGWILVVEHDTKEIFAPVAKLKKTLLLVPFGATILALVLALFISHFISTPITKLKDSAAEIGAGNFDTNIVIKSNDEIGQLAASFKKMAEDLKATTTSIDNLNQEITERKKAEEILERVNEDLESAVRELNRSNKELQDFAYVTAHDLKSPLRAIGALAHWISTDYADKFDEDGREQMKLLMDRVKRMHNLIEAILHYARIGRENERHVQVNLNELVPEVIDMVAPPRNITITIENQLPVIECEETCISLVFQNLLSNAVKYLDKPQGQIRIGCVEEEGFWKFSVADNGPGIEEKYFEKIFQIFQTLSPRDEVENTGVGLTLIKKIVELYGGKIWVESKPREGSIFFFTLPKQQMAVEDAKHKADTVC